MPRLFTKINSKCQDFGLEFNTQKIRLDFESAPIGVIEELYPTCRLSGCSFHFNQCLWRKVHTIGLSVQYAQADSAVREHVRSVAALAHLSPADILEEWLALMVECPTDVHPQLANFNYYFVDTWLADDAKIPVDIWNVYGEDQKRTNNHVEG